METQAGWCAHEASPTSVSKQGGREPSSRESRKATLV